MEIVERDGKKYIRTEYSIDFGPKNGTATVTVYDPCVTEESQERRRAFLAGKCRELLLRGSAGKEQI